MAKSPRSPKSVKKSRPKEQAEIQAVKAQTLAKLDAQLATASAERRAAGARCTMLAHEILRNDLVADILGELPRAARTKKIVRGLAFWAESAEDARKELRGAMEDLGAAEERALRAGAPAMHLVPGLITGATFLELLDEKKRIRLPKSLRFLRREA